MHPLESVAPAFVEMAHGIVWASVATVDREKRPRSRILHPIWEWDGTRLEGFVATGPTPTKRAHLEFSPHVSVNYWAPDQNTCVAECRASWIFDDASRTELWNLFKNTPEPVGYDPAMIPVWESPQSEAFAGLRLEPWRLRVFPGSALTDQQGILVWQE